MPNYENFFQYEYWQYEVIRHLFSLTFAVFAAALVYFAMTVRSVVPRFRSTAIISAVVMVSAFLEIVALWFLWNTSFAAVDSATGVHALVDGQIFSNGYRYANWLIDVPMLLTQFIIVLGFTAAAFWKKWWRLATAGVLMIITGYIGQYYEPFVSGHLAGNGLPFWIWGGISWLFFFWLLFEANAAYKQGIHTLTSPLAAKNMKLAWTVLWVTWFLYGFAYLVPGIPGLGQSADWVVYRQIGYTVADIVSKTVFGIILARVAMQQSAFENPAYNNGEPYPVLTHEVGATPISATDTVAIAD